MDVAAPARPHWTVSTRHDGEVLTVWTGGDELWLGVLATSGSFTAPEYEGWLNDLAGVARETSIAGTDAGPIPGILHQAVSGLLFSHVELWERSGGPHASIALIVDGDEVGIGWVGKLGVEVAIDGEQTDVPWVVVRDSDGNEAHAAKFDAARWLKVAIMWTPREDSTDGAMIDAEWTGGSAGASAAVSAGAIVATKPGVVPADEALIGAEPEVAAPTDRHEAPAPVIAELHEESVTPIDAHETPAIEEMPEPMDEEFAAPPRREGAWARFWIWFMGKPKARRQPAARGRSNDPPWVDIGGAAEESEAAYASTHSEMETLEDENALETTEPGIDEEARIESEYQSERADDLEPEPGSFDESAAETAPPNQSSPPRPSLAAPIGQESAEFELAGVPLLNDPEAAPVHAAEPGDEEVLPEGAVTSRVPLRPRWPSAMEIDAPRPWWMRRWAWGAGIAVLFGVGWLVGGIQQDQEPATRPNAFTRMLRAIGLGGAIYECSIGSHPPGAWIAVDGKDTGRRTPATIELRPGEHDVALSFTDLGSAGFKVNGKRGDHAALDETLWGSLSIEQVNASIPVAVAVDGRALGYVPTVLDSVDPGAHEVRFSGPGMTPWAQTVEVRVREAARVVAHPMVSPGTGVLVVSAVLNDEQGSEALNGGDVWIDGEERGKTPFTVELPRGPHSVRVVARGESAPVQVIDLPGGNQRFATFEIGIGAGGPQLVEAQKAEHVAADHPTLVSGALDGVRVADVREMWLHVRGPDGPWRRYALDIMKSPSGVIGVTVFPLGVFDNDGKTQYYLSALTSSGDEYFTEIKTAQLMSAR